MYSSMKQCNTGYRSAGGASMFSAFSAVWTYRRGSSQRLAGGPCSPERWEVLHQESSAAAWRAAGGGRSSFWWDWWRWFKWMWRDRHADMCSFMLWALSLHFSDDHIKSASLWECSLHLQTQSCTNEPHRSDIKVSIPNVTSLSCCNTYCLFLLYSVPCQTEEVCTVALLPGSNHQTSKKTISWLYTIDHLFSRFIFQTIFFMYFWLISFTHQANECHSIKQH